MSGWWSFGGLAATGAVAAKGGGEAGMRFPWMADLSALLHAFSELFWPVLAVIVIAALRKPLAAVLTQLGERGGTVKIGSAEVSISQAAKQNSDNVGDLLTQVAQLQGKMLEIEKAASGGNEAPARAVAAATTPDPAQLAGIRLLWVDDRPQNNVMIASNFEKLQMVVDTAQTTDAGLRMFEDGHYDAVITDMARAGEAEAGINLTKAIRQRRADVPVFIYCGPGGARYHGAAARAAGATEVTDSQTVLTRHIMNLKKLVPPS